MSEEIIKDLKILEDLEILQETVVKKIIKYIELEKDIHIEKYSINLCKTNKDGDFTGFIRLYDNENLYYDYNNNFISLKLFIHYNHNYNLKYKGLYREEKEKIFYNNTLNDSELYVNQYDDYEILILKGTKLKHPFIKNYKWADYTVRYGANNYWNELIVLVEKDIVKEVLLER